MNSKTGIRQGGRAFPHPRYVDIKGMTLRDYFAAKAMQALVAAPDIDLGLRAIADCAYKQADAMIKAKGEQ